MKNLWKTLTAAVIAVLMLGAVSAAALDTGAECSLRVQLAENVPEELAAVPAEVSLYRVASVDEDYVYASLLEGLDLSGYRDVTTAEEQKETAEKAAALVAETEADVTGKAEKGVVDFEGLETGLYLVAVETVQAGEHEYSFSPVLVSLPSMEGYTDDGQTQWSGADMYTIEDGMTVTMKYETAPLYGTVSVTKTLARYNASSGVVTCVFRIEAVLDGESVYSDVEALTFTGADEKTFSVEIPLGADVTVTEIYSGAGYTLAEGYEAAQTLHLGWPHDENGEDIVSYNDDGEAVMDLEDGAAFVNDFDETSQTTGTSVTNSFYYEADAENGGRWNWTPTYNQGNEG